MKHKTIGILTLVAMLFVTMFATYELTADTSHSKARVHQHIEGRQPEEGCDCDKSELCTHLPLMILDTAGEEIPGDAITDQNGVVTGHTKTPAGEKMIHASMKLMDSEEHNHHPSDKPDLESDTMLRIRGNSSRLFPKKGYLLRLTDETGNYQDRSLAGMDPHYEWALHGPYMDKTLIRNYMCYNLAGEFMEYSPNVRFCELIVNGAYQGVYLITETITNGKNCRLNMEKSDEKASATSYVIRLDRGSDNPEKNIHNFTNYVLSGMEPTDIQYPTMGSLTPEKRRFIEQDLSDAEKALYSFDYDTKEHGYDKNFDVNSFVDYFILTEFTQNVDVGKYSTYLARDIGGKLTMIPWDFNSAFDNNEMPLDDKESFMLQGKIWYFMMTKDESFNERIIKQYRELRESFLNEEYMYQYIDDTVRYLGDAVDRNYEVWGDSFNQEILHPEERNPKSYEEAVKQLKETIHERGEWMDENIDIIRQYSHESKTKKYNH